MASKRRFVLLTALVAVGVGLAPLLRVSGLATPSSWVSLVLTTVLLALPVGLVASLVSDLRLRRLARRDWLASHGPLPAEAFAAALPSPCDAAVVEAVRAAVAMHSGVPSDRVRPEDRLNDLVVICGEGWDWAEFAFTVEEKLSLSLDEQVVRDGLRRLEQATVGDLVHATQSAIRRSAGQTS